MASTMRHAHRHTQQDHEPTPSPVDHIPPLVVGLVAVPGLTDPQAPLRRLSYDPLGGGVVSHDVSSALRRRRGHGATMPESLAQGFGEHFGMDMSSVRIHTDAEAGQIATSLQATAFTHGDDIYFAPGAYQPGSPDGQHVLAHEVSHVHAQRTGADRGAGGPLAVGRADDPAEAAADRSATDALSALRRSTNPAGLPGDVAAATRGPHAGYDVIPGQAPTHTTGTDLRRWPWSRSKSKDKGKGTGKDTAKDGDAQTDLYPRTISLGKESVVIEKKEDEKEAKDIVKTLRSKYGITLSSAATIKGIKGQYTRVDSSVTDSLEADAWTMDELRSLSESASYYAPILGSRRAKSKLGKKSQGVTSIGKLKNAIDKNSSEGKLDTSTLGEYFSDKKNMGMFSAGTQYKDDSFVRPGAAKTDVSTSLTATAIHEMAHGLVQPYELNNWVTKLSYWSDRYTESGEAGAEAPPTDYGETNAAEDLCESVALFFVNRAALKSACPERETFIAAVVAAWTPAKKKKAMKDSAEAKGAEQAPAQSGAGAGSKQPVGANA